MKKILFAIMAVFAMGVVANAQLPVPTGQLSTTKKEKKIDVKFWGIPFGTSMAKTKALMLQKGETKEAANIKNAISFEDTPNFAGFKTSMVACFFTNSDELAKGVVVLEPSSEQQIFNMYSSVKDLFQKKYGAPESDYSFFKSPYKEGDGYEITAIRAEKCHYSAFWTINKGDDAVDIYIQITKDVKVVIQYEHNLLFAKRAKEKEKDAMNDI